MTNPNSNTSSIPKTRKPRQKKWASEIARQQHSNARRALAREAAARESERLSRGLEDIKRAAYRQSRQEVNKRSNMIANGLTPRLTAVMNSWGLTLPVSIVPARTVSGSTNFKQIKVTHDHRLTTSVNSHGFAEDKVEGVVSDEELRQIAAETRGVFYHEVGHNLFTVPLPDVITAAADAGYQPHSEQATVAQMGDTWTRWNIDSSFHRAWNVLEDQRMEMLLVEESPAIASMLTVLVVRNMIRGAGSDTAWALVAGRYYLPNDVRDAARLLWDKQGRYEPNRPTSHAIKSVVDRYMVADDVVTMMTCIEEMRVMLNGMIVNNTDDHSGLGKGGASGSSSEDTQQTTAKVKQSGERAQQIADERQDDEQGSGSAPSESNDEQQDGSGDGGGQESSEQQDTDGASGGSDNSAQDDGLGHSAGEGEDDHSAVIEQAKSRREAQETLKDALDDLLEDLSDDGTLNDDVTAMNEAYNVDEGSLPKFGGIVPNEDDNDRSKAQSMVDDIERAFNIATADCAPHWESQQRRGVLEPIRYRTRQPGDMEVFRSWSEDGEPGTDICVSLFLDVSGSMQYSGSALGAMAWAVKTACDRIGIECDVTAFDHGAYNVWGVNESPIDIPFLNCTGGTCPNEAFTAMLWEERPQKHHIVMVMTDGEWSDSSVFSPFKHSNIHSMMFYYDGSGTTPMSPSPRWARKVNMHEAYEIGNLSDIPMALESMLIGLI